MPEHVIVHLGHNTVLVLAVEEPDVGRAYFVLVLDGIDQPVHCWWDEVKGCVDILKNIKMKKILSVKSSDNTSVSCLT